MEKKWKYFPGCDCPNCGSEIEVLSESPAEKDTESEVWVFDQEEARCADGCGFIAQTVVSEDFACIDDGNIEELQSE